MLNTLFLMAWGWTQPLEYVDFAMNQNEAMRIRANFHAPQFFDVGIAQLDIVTKPLPSLPDETVAQMMFIEGGARLKLQKGLVCQMLELQMLEHAFVLDIFENHTALVRCQHGSQIPNSEMEWVRKLARMYSPSPELLVQQYVQGQKPDEETTPAMFFEIAHFTKSPLFGNLHFTDL